MVLLHHVEIEEAGTIEGLTTMGRSEVSYSWIAF
jgi:hypothetical protein